jgi:adenylate cyclase
MSAQMNLPRRLDRVLKLVTRQRSRLPATSEYGSWLLGRVSESQHLRRIRIQFILTVVIVTTNLIGILVALLLIGFAFQVPSVFRDAPVWLTFVVAPGYIAVALMIGTYWITRRTVQVLRWAIEDRKPTSTDGRNTFLAPWHVAAVTLGLWALGAGLLTTLYGLVEDSLFIPEMLFTVGFCGVLVATACYLFTEFALRPVAAQALATAPPPRRFATGIMGRTMVVWLLGSGVPVLGIALTAIFSDMVSNLTMDQFRFAVLILATVTLIFGFVLMWLLSWLTATPVRMVRAALQRVEQGDLCDDLVVFDGTELGQLQSGFNAMATGLRERERVRDLFGRHVGREVAAVAERERTHLGGEERYVAVVFVDIAGSTQVVTSQRPTEVVKILNRFFAVIVDEVDRHHGLVNKFEGDAALAVFGAPNHLASPADEALAAARTIADRLSREVPECQAGIGVIAGTVVAGNVGANSRFEYTVIGEPVHVAARLCELAKREPFRLLASSQTVNATSENKRVRWCTGPTVTLRGHDRPTLLAAPA